MYAHTHTHLKLLAAFSKGKDASICHLEQMKQMKMQLSEFKV